jgi:hypothetical protein
MQNAAWAQRRWGLCPDALRSGLRLVRRYRRAFSGDMIVSRAPTIFASVMLAGLSALTLVACSSPGAGSPGATSGGTWASQSGPAFNQYIPEPRD